MKFVSFIPVGMSTVPTHINPAAVMAVTDESMTPGDNVNAQTCLYLITGVQLTVKGTVQEVMAKLMAEA